MLRQSIVLISLIIISTILISSCCKPTALAVDAKIVFKGFPEYTMVFELRTPRGDPSTHLDTIRFILTPDNQHADRINLQGYDDPPSDWLITADSFKTIHTITEVDIIKRKGCGDEVKEFYFLFDGQQRHNWEESVIYK